MSATVNRRPPKYRRHRQSGQAVVTLPDGYGGRKDYLLGTYGSAASRQEYNRVIAWWIGNGRRLPLAGDASPSVIEVILAYYRHCQGYYLKPDGKPTQELANVRAALQYVKELYGRTAAAAFDCLALKAVRQKMIDAGLCRNSVNKDVGRVKRCFRWAAGEKLVPAAVYHELQAIEGLRYGRCAAKETEPIKPVPVAHVEAVLPFLPPVVADMVRLQLATGMRAGEVCIIRAIDVDITGTVWLYRPQQHKTQHRGHQRIVALGPKSQAIIRRYLKPQVDAYLFAPKDTVLLFRQEQRRQRKTPVQPSQANRKKKKPLKVPGERYTPATYAQAIQDGWRKADADARRRHPDVAEHQAIIPKWTSHQLRHTAAQLIQREYGLDAARAVLGHRSPCLTALYAAVDTVKASEVAAKIG